MTNEGANWGGNRRRENEEEEISRGMVDRSAQCTQCRGEISITWTRRGWSETKKLENFKFRFNFNAFRRLGNKSADSSEMLAETHEINHRRRHWAPFQNRNVTTERAPPLVRWRISNEPDCRFSFLSFSPPFELHCTRFRVLKR